MAGSHPLIVFDLDGTLVDSRRDLVDSMNAVIVESGGQPLATDTVVSMIGSGARVLVERACEAAALGRATDATLERFLAIYDRHLLDHTRAYDGVPEVLDALGRGRHILAVLTNKPRHPSMRVLEGLGLAHHFTQVIGGDGPDGRKPDPAGLIGLMASVHADADSTWLVGDSFVDLQTARNADVTCCLARYGFGYPGIPVGARDGREHVIDVPKELLERISGSGLAPGADRP